MTFTPNNPNGYVTCEDKLPVRILATDLKGLNPIAAAITNKDDREFVRTFNENGKRFDDMDSGFDLIDKPVTVTRWVNIYKGGGISYFWHLSREDADRGAENGRIACIPVTYTEGEGL